LIDGGKRAYIGRSADADTPSVTFGYVLDRREPHNRIGFPTVPDRHKSVRTTGVHGCAAVGVAATIMTPNQSLPLSRRPNRSATAARGPIPKPSEVLSNEVSEAPLD